MQWYTLRSAVVTAAPRRTPVIGHISLDQAFAGTVGQIRLDHALVGTYVCRITGVIFWAIGAVC